MQNEHNKKRVDLEQPGLIHLQHVTQHFGQQLRLLRCRTNCCFETGSHQCHQLLSIIHRRYRTLVLLLALPPHIQGLH